MHHRSKPPSRCRGSSHPHLGRWAQGCLAFLALAWAGCASSPPPPTKPAAVAEAERVATQAARFLAEGNWQGAAVWWKRAGEQYALLNLAPKSALAWHNEGLARRALGEWETARTLWERAAESNVRSGLTNAWWRNQLALLQGERERDAAAARVRAQPLVDRRATLTDVWLSALLDHELAALELVEDRASEALEKVQRAERVFGSLGDRTAQAASLILRAQVLRRLGRSEDSEAAWRSALAAYGQLGDPPGVAVALAGLGSLLATLEGRAAEAEGLLAQAEANLGGLRRDQDRLAVAAERAALRSRREGQRR